MEDKLNPTSQFHPYQPPDQSVLGSGRRGGLSDMMRKAGIDGHINKARELARKNPGAVLGGLAALVIGAGLMRGRR